VKVSLTRAFLPETYSRPYLGSVEGDTESSANETLPQCSGVYLILQSAYYKRFFCLSVSRHEDNPIRRIVMNTGEKNRKLSTGQQEGRDREPEDLGIDGSIVLKWILVE
jgi:hypothetical protein